MNLTFYGMKMIEGLPSLCLLERDLPNLEHVNHIEIARALLVDHELENFAAIVLTMQDMIVVYSQAELRRRG